MTISGTDPSFMYAQSGVARASATRSGYMSMLPYIAIGGVQYASGGSDPARRITVNGLSVHDALDDQPDTCAFVALGTPPPLGAEVVFTLGSKNSFRRTFGGIVLQVQQGYWVGNPNNLYWACNAIDYTWELGQRLVMRQYTAQTVGFILRDLMTTYAPPTYTTNHIAPELDAAVLDTLSITDTALGDALSQVMVRAGGHWHMDYFADLHASVSAEPGAPTPIPLTPAHPTLSTASLAITRDLSQMITRAIVEGGGVNASATIAPGESVIPLDGTAAWYQPGGGYCSSGPQRMRYTAVDVGGAGSLVGPGIGPSAAPVATLQAGAGVTPGTHSYAITFRTAAGESLPSPLATLAVGLRAAPPDAPTENPAQAGTGVNVGVHTYAVSDVTSAGETVPGPGLVVTVANIATPTGTPTNSGFTGVGIQGPTGAWTAGAVVQVQITYGTSTDLSKQTALGPVSAGITLPQAAGYPAGNYYGPVVNLPVSADPAVQWITLWGFVPGVNNTPVWCGRAPNASGAQATIGPSTATPYTTPNPAIGVRSINIAAGAAGLTGRKLYRTAAGAAQLKLVAAIAAAGNAAYLDSTPDASLGANALTVGTATAAQVALSAIAVGSASVTGRKIYRTAANAAQLQLLATLGDNTTTTYTDAAADSALGANLPPGDTSGIQQPNGQVLPGAASLPVAGVGAFMAAGGWAVIGNGQQVIRYTGIAGGALIGIPASGPGAITAAVAFNSTATAAPSLRGFPASGAGAIRYPIASGDPIDLVIIVDDTTAQSLLASLIGGSGVKESKITDRRISVAEATARGGALLAQRDTIDLSLTYTVRDLNSVSGAIVVVDLPPPHNVSASLKIQDLVLAGFSAKPGITPTATVTASTARYTFEDLLRVTRSAVGVDPNGTGN